MFTRDTSAGVVTFVGNPDDSSAHEWVRHWLASEVHVTFAAPAAVLPNTTKGNLGEAITAGIGHHFDYADYSMFAVNLYCCTSDSSHPDIDIVWIGFGTDAHDVAVLQEVKTTSGPSLALADRLTDDYAKLFGGRPRLTLQARLGAIAADYRYAYRQPDLASRVTALSGPSAEMCPSVVLVPTLVHEVDTAASVEKLVAVRLTVVAQGWSGAQVVPWSIRFAPIYARLKALREGATL